MEYQIVVSRRTTKEKCRRLGPRGEGSRGETTSHHSTPYRTSPHHTAPCHTNYTTSQHTTQHHAHAFLQLVPRLLRLLSVALCQSSLQFFPCCSNWATATPQAIFRVDFWSYYCHVSEKSEFGYTAHGGWTFWEFVDFGIFLSYPISGMFRAGPVQSAPRKNPVLNIWPRSGLVQKRGRSGSCFQNISRRTFTNADTNTGVRWWR